MILREKQPSMGRLGSTTDTLMTSQFSAVPALPHLQFTLQSARLDTNSAIRKPLLRRTLQRIERRGWSSVGRHLL